MGVLIPTLSQIDKDPPLGTTLIYIIEKHKHAMLVEYTLQACGEYITVA